MIFKALLFNFSRTLYFVTLSFCSSLQCQDYFKLTFQLMFFSIRRRLKSPNSVWNVLSFHFHSLPLSSHSCFLTSHLSGIPGFGHLNRTKYPPWPPHLQGSPCFSMFSSVSLDPWLKRRQIYWKWITSIVMNCQISGITRN